MDQIMMLALELQSALKLTEEERKLQYGTKSLELIAEELIVRIDEVRTKISHLR